MWRLWKWVYKERWIVDTRKRALYRRRKEKENVCSTFGKEFSKTENLIRHKQIHQSKVMNAMDVRNLVNTKTTLKSTLAVL